MGCCSSKELVEQPILQQFVNKPNQPGKDAQQDYANRPSVPKSPHPANNTPTTIPKSDFSTPAKALEVPEDLGVVNKYNSNNDMMDTLIKSVAGKTLDNKLPKGWFHISDCACYFNFGTLDTQKNGPVFCKTSYCSLPNMPTYIDIENACRNLHKKKIENLFDFICDNFTISECASPNSVPNDVKLLIELVEFLLDSVERFADSSDQSAEANYRLLKDEQKNLKELLYNHSLSLSKHKFERFSAFPKAEIADTLFELFTIVICQSMVVPSLKLCSSTCGRPSPYHKELHSEFLSVNEKSSNACQIIFPAVVREDDGQIFYNALVVSFLK